MVKRDSVSPYILIGMIFILATLVILLPRIINNQQKIVCCLQGIHSIIISDLERWLLGELNMCDEPNYSELAAKFLRYAQVGSNLGQISPNTYSNMGVVYALLHLAKVHEKILTILQDLKESNSDD